MNKVFLIGRLTKDPDLRYSQNGTAVANFILAVERFGKKDEADFILCTAFQKTAENICKYLSKGSQIAISGFIQTGSYDKDGEKKYTWQVVAHQVQFLGNAGSKKEDETAEYRAIEEDVVPF